MKQLSLVFFYNHIPDDLAELVTDCQSRLSDALGEQFEPVPLSKVHSTLASLERLNEDSFLNQKFAILRNEHKEMDFEGLLDFIKNSPLFPFTIQIGGFENTLSPIKSLQESAYSRTFTFRQTIAVTIGWPKHGNDYPLTLYTIRKQLESFNILYSYHPKPSDMDNDFYFRIGYTSTPENPQIKQIEEEIRNYLSKRKSIFLNVTPSDLDLVIFESPYLPTQTTQSIPLFAPQVSSDYIRHLYQSG